MDEVRVQVQFTKTTPEGIHFTDALYYSLDEYAKLSTDEIEAAKQARFDAWQEVIKNPTPIDVKDQLASITDQIDSLTQQKQELEAQVEVSTVGVS